MAVEAGNAMIMAPWRPNMAQAIITGMKAKLQQGAITQEQIGASVTRILALKIRYQLIPGATGSPRRPPRQPPRRLLRLPIRAVVGCG
jgi:hypothetical protein